MSTASHTLELKVTVGDTWLPLELPAAPHETIAQVKKEALETENIGAHQHGLYEVKLGGVLIRDESRTLEQLGIRSGAALIILSRRRRPVR